MNYWQKKSAIQKIALFFCLGERPEEDAGTSLIFIQKLHLPCVDVV